MNQKLYELPVPSTDFTDDVQMDHRGDRVILRFSYDKDGTIYHSGLLFNAPTALRHRAERSCIVDQIESSYDTLIEITDSDWVSELRADTAEGWKDSWETHHYRIYMDSAGCYEVVAESWSVLPEE